MVSLTIIHCLKKVGFRIVKLPLMDRLPTGNQQRRDAETKRTHQNSSIRWCGRRWRSMVITRHRRRSLSASRGKRSGWSTLLFGTMLWWHAVGRCFLLFLSSISKQIMRSLCQSLLDLVCDCYYCYTRAVEVDCSPLTSIDFSFANRGFFLLGKRRGIV